MSLFHTKMSDVVYLVKLGNGVVWKRHIDQIVAVDTGVVVDEGVVDVNNADSQLSVKSPESLEGQSADLKTPESYHSQDAIPPLTTSCQSWTQT